METQFLSRQEIQMRIVDLAFQVLDSGLIAGTGLEMELKMMKFLLDEPASNG